MRDTVWAARLLRPETARVVGVSLRAAPRVALITATLEGREPHPEVIEGVNTTARCLETLGCVVEPAVWPAALSGTINAFVTMWAFLAHEAVSGIVDPQSASAPGVVEPWTLGLARSVVDNPVPLEAFYEFAAAAEAAAADLFSRFDLVLCPVVSTPPPATGLLSPERPFEALLRDMFDFVAYTPFQNIAGLPSVSIPTYESAEGLPVGSMITVPRGCDDWLLDLLERLDVISPWATLPHDASTCAAHLSMSSPMAAY